MANAACEQAAQKPPQTLQALSAEHIELDAKRSEIECLTSQGARVTRKTVRPNACSPRQMVATGSPHCVGTATERYTHVHPDRTCEWSYRGLHLQGPACTHVHTESTCHPAHMASAGYKTHLHRWLCTVSCIPAPTHTPAGPTPCPSTERKPCAPSTPHTVRPQMRSLRRTGSCEP